MDGEIVNGNVEQKTGAGGDGFEELAELADQFDPETAEKLQNGEEATENIEESAAETAAETKEQEPEKAEQKEREQSAAERKLAAVEEKLRQIEQDLMDENSNKEKLEEEVEACEAAVEENVEEHDRLSDRAAELKAEVRRTKRSVVNNFMNGLRIARGMALGRHEEIFKLTAEINENATANQTAMEDQHETQIKLEENVAEKEELDTALENAVDRRDASARKISRLERQKEAAAQQINRLKEEIQNEAWADAWQDAQEGIKAEMGTNNMSEFRRELGRESKKNDKALKKELEDTKFIRDRSRVLSIVFDADPEQAATRLGKYEEEIKAAHDREAQKIATKREKVDRYFPTWQERVKNVRENNLVGGALATLKRKILMAMYRA